MFSRRTEILGTHTRICNDAFHSWKNCELILARKFSLKRLGRALEWGQLMSTGADTRGDCEITLLSVREGHIRGRGGLREMRDARWHRRSPSSSRHCHAVNRVGGRNFRDDRGWPPALDGLDLAAPAGMGRALLPRTTKRSMLR